VNKERQPLMLQTVIKVCLRGAKTCMTLPLFCDRDFEINPMTLKLEGDLDISKIYVHTNNEAASLRHSKLKSSELLQVLL